MAADRQARGGEHHVWAARAFGAGEASRLICYGRCNSTSELEEIHKHLKARSAASGQSGEQHGARRAPGEG